MKRPSAVVLGVLLCAVLPAYASGQGTAKVKKAANEISMEELADPVVSSLNVRDAVQRLRPNWMRSRGATSTRSSGQGATGAVGASCRSSNCSAISVSPGADAPGVVLNGHAEPFDILRSIKAREVTSLQFLSAADATTLYGTGFTQGVIQVSTVAVQR